MSEEHIREALEMFADPRNWERVELDHLRDAEKIPVLGWVWKLAVDPRECARVALAKRTT